MIIKTSHEYISMSNAKHIVFAINREGIIDLSFPRHISNEYDNHKLGNIGLHEIGTVLSKKIGDKTFYALVCYSLSPSGHGWRENQAEIIKECFDKIPANGDIISTIEIGSNFMERISGANFSQIICGMHDSQQKIILHSKYTMDKVINLYNEENKRQETLEKILTLK